GGRRSSNPTPPLHGSSGQTCSRSSASSRASTSSTPARGRLVGACPRGLRHLRGDPRKRGARFTTVWLRDSSADVRWSGALLVGVCRRNSPRELCQNCVTYPPKPGVNTSIYEDTCMNIVVVGSR